MTKRYFELELEVPGHAGKKSRVDRSTSPPRFESLHFIFEGWERDELLASYPVYLATRSLADRFAEYGLTGFAAAPVEVERGPAMIMLQPELELPDFVWFQVNGIEGGSDFFDNQGNLVVSEAALDIILATSPAMLMHVPFD